MIKSLELIVLGERIFPAHVLMNGDTSAEAYLRHVSTMIHRETLWPLPGASGLALAWRRKSNKEIARQLDISDETVKVHVKAILQKRLRTEGGAVDQWLTRPRIAPRYRPEAVRPICRASPGVSQSLSMVSLLPKLGSFRGFYPVLESCRQT